MRVFTTTELSRMQGTQDSAMMDSCKILAYSAVADDYGNAAETYTAGDEMDCGFDPTANREVMDDTEVVITDAALRLPIDTDVSNLDRIQITKRHGVDVADETFEIVGNAERGPSGLVLKLRRVTDE
jgi:head-tail adaptor